MTAAASPPRPPSEGDDGPSTTSTTTSTPSTAETNGTDGTKDTDGISEGTDEEAKPIRVAKEGTTVVICVEGDLDITTGEALIDAAEAAVRTGPTRLDIDLRALEDFDEAGAGALVSCRELGAQLAEGLHYRTGRGPGRDALLAAYTETEGDTTPE